MNMWMGMNVADGMKNKMKFPKSNLVITQLNHLYIQPFEGTSL